MMKKEKMKENKPYNVALLWKDFVVIEVVILYITLILGDLIRVASKASIILTRYVPIAFVTLVSTFLIIRSKSKKCKKSEENEVEKTFVIAPVVVAIIMFFYGLYSASVNMSKAEEQLRKETKIYSLLYEKSEYEEMIQEALKEARSLAIQNWIITSVTYLVSAEIMVLLSSKKLKLWLKDEMIVENSIEGMQAEGNIMNDSVIKMEDNTQATDSIKWNL